MTTVVDGITFRVEGRDAPSKCCADGGSDLSALQGSVHQAQPWTDVVGAYARSNANGLTFMVLSVVVAVLFAIKKMRQSADHAPGAMRQRPALLSNAYLHQTDPEEAARIAFLKRYGGPTQASLQLGKEQL